MKNILKKLNKLMILTAVSISIGITTAYSQKTPDYKITDIRMMPFDSQTGKFQDLITPENPRSFFNDIAISMLVQIEISGKEGTFEVGRKVEVTVMEGKKVKKKLVDQIGLIGGDGKFYVPVWLDAAMCDEISITAKIVVGKKVSVPVKRKVSFMCGE